MGKFLGTLVQRLVGVQPNLSSTLKAELTSLFHFPSVAQINFIATNLHIVHLAIKVTKSRLALLDSSCSEYTHIVHVCTCRFMATLLRTKRRLYVRPTATWRDELRALYGNFISYYFRLITPGSHLVYLPELIANYILNYF